MNGNMTVTKKASPHPTATNLIRVVSIRILLEYSCDKSRSTEVTRSIIAIAASHMLRSESVSEIYMSTTITFCLQTNETVDSSVSILSQRFIYKYQELVLENFPTTINNAF